MCVLDQMAPTIRYGTPMTTAKTISSPTVTWNPNSRRSAPSTLTMLMAILVYAITFL
jgi:hypothetical protein